MLRITFTESHSPNLIHRIAFTELKFEDLSRGAEGVSAGGGTLKHSRTHAPTGPRETLTYINRERRKMEEKDAEVKIRKA